MMSTSKRRPEQPARETVRDAGQITSSNGLLDPEVKEEFDNFQRQIPPGSRRLAEQRSSSDSQSPELTDGALDAAWNGSDVDEESRDGSASTPDQNSVDELGEQAGLTFRDYEFVDAPGKVGRRDRDRWELEPASSEDYCERQYQPAEVPMTSEARP